MESTVISGKYYNYNNLDIISNYANNVNVANKNTKSNHIWTQNIKNNVDVYNAIEEVRCSNTLINAISNLFPNTRIKNARRIDEIYWAVSPKTASGSDRSLVDCHYDAPYGSITTDIIFYMIIIACNEQIIANAKQ